MILHNSEMNASFLTDVTEEQNNWKDKAYYMFETARKYREEISKLRLMLLETANYKKLNFDDYTEIQLKIRGKTKMEELTKTEKKEIEESYKIRRKSDNGWF